MRFNSDKEDLNRIIRPKNISRVIHLGTDVLPAKSIQINKCKTEISFNPLKVKYLLHVGSAAWYKNRKAVFKAFQIAKLRGDQKDLKLVLVGPKPQAHEVDLEMREWIDSTSNIISLQNISRNALYCLYNFAEFLIFPSIIEGFGCHP